MTRSMNAGTIAEPAVDAPRLTGVERTLGADDIIVSKTDLKGRITYANRTFIAISGYSEPEFLGKAHNIVRHPDMPRCVFRFLWETIEAGGEVFAYVLNRSKNGDHYWVLAHVTPTRDARGAIIGYHSNRRAPGRGAVEQVKQVYAALLAEERRHRLPGDQWKASLPMLVQFLADRKTTYEEFMFTLM